MKTILSLFVFLLAFNNSFSQFYEETNDYREIPLIRVISNPEKYDNQYVVVKGFLHVKFEDSRLFITKDDADYMNTFNSVWIDYDSNIVIETINNIKDVRVYHLDGEYVTIKGLFTYRPNVMGSDGIIVGVNNIIENKRLYDGSYEIWEESSDKEKSDEQKKVDENVKKYQKIFDEK